MNGAAGARCNGMGRRTYEGPDMVGLEADCSIGILQLYLLVEPE